MKWPPESLGSGLTASLAFGVLGVVLMLVGYKLFDLITPGVRLDHELAERQNVAVAIVTAAFIIGIAIVTAAAIS